jgi:hypothetical protein
MSAIMFQKNEKKNLGEDGFRSVHEHQPTGSGFSTKEEERRGQLGGDSHPGRPGV